MSNYIYLLWDHKREEHGEGPEFVNAYATEELAKIAREKMTDYSHIEEDWSPEEIAEAIEEATESQFTINKVEVKEEA